MRPNIVSEASLQTRLGSWWEGIPFFTSTIIIACGVVYLVCLLVGYDSFAEVCFLPLEVISHFQGSVLGCLSFPLRIPDQITRFTQSLYRIFTSIIFHGSLLHVLFNMLAFVPLGSELERIMGSIRLFYIVVLLATSNAVIHLLIALIVAYNPFLSYPELMHQCAIGFSGVLFSMIVIETSLSGIQSRSVFGLFNVPAKWYALILLVVFQLLMPNVSLLGHLSGILSGFLYTYGFFNIIIPDTSRFSAIESSSWLSACVRRPKFMMCTGSNVSGHLPTYSSQNTTSSGLLSGNMWRNFSSLLPQRENPPQSMEGDSRFPGAGRTLGSNPNRGSSIGNPDSNLMARLLDDNDSQRHLSGPSIGGQQKPTGRPAAENTVAAAATTRESRHEGHVPSDEDIQKLVAMGFEKTQVEVAVSAADGDLNVAVEILMTQKE